MTKDKKKLCAVREIKFKASCHLPGVKHAAGGKCYKTFMGRKGGSELCGARKASKAQVAWRKVFGAAAAHCAGKKKSKTCVADRLAFLVGRKSKRTARAAPRSAPRPRSDRAERVLRRAGAEPVDMPGWWDKKPSGGVDTSICDNFKANPVRYNLCLKNLRAGNTLKPG